MKNIFLLILILVFIFSCNTSKNSKVERDDEPEVYNVDDSDSAMNDAMDKAQNTFNLFEDAFKNKNDNYSYSVKQKFTSSNNDVEHIWIIDVKKKGSDYYGIVNNHPIYISSIKLRDEVKIVLDQLSDWMILENETGNVKGGYTIQVLRNNMSEEEKQRFDTESGLIFE